MTNKETDFGCDLACDESLVYNSMTFYSGKSLVWGEKIVGAATIVADSKV